MAPSPQKKKQKTYRKFDGCAKAIRDGVLSACAKSYLQHLEENGGKCKRGFVKSLVDEAKQSAPTYGISRDDIKNEVRRLKKSESEARPTQDDAPAGDVAEEATRVSPLHFFADIAAEAAPTTTAATNVDEAPGDPSPSMTSAGVAAVAASDSAPPAAGVAVSDSASSPPAAGARAKFARVWLRADRGRRSSLPSNCRTRGNPQLLRLDGHPPHDADAKSGKEK